MILGNKSHSAGERLVVDWHPNQLRGLIQMKTWISITCMTLVYNSIFFPARAGSLLQSESWLDCFHLHPSSNLSKMSNHTSLMTHHCFGHQGKIKTYYPMKKVEILRRQVVVKIHIDHLTQGTMIPTLQEL